MPKRLFKCSKCSRKFTMAAHLARHKNAIHGGRGRRKAAGRKTGMAHARRAIVRRSPTRAVPSSGAPGGGAVRLLKEMDAYRSELALQRDALDVEINNVDAALDTISGISTGATTTPRRRIKTRRTAAGPRARSIRTGRRARVGRPGKARRIKARRGRPAGSRKGSLKQVIVKVLRQKSKPMAPKDIAVAVKASGYRTKATDLTKVVSNTLPEVNSVRRVGRAQYTV